MLFLRLGNEIVSQGETRRFCEFLGRVEAVKTCWRDGRSGDVFLEVGI